MNCHWNVQQFRFRLNWLELTHFAVGCIYWLTSTLVLTSSKTQTLPIQADLGEISLILYLNLNLTSIYTSASGDTCRPLLSCLWSSNDTQFAVSASHCCNRQGRLKASRAASIQKNLGCFCWQNAFATRVLSCWVSRSVAFWQRCVLYSSTGAFHLLKLPEQWNQTELTDEPLCYAPLLLNRRSVWPITTFIRSKHVQSSLDLLSQCSTSTGNMDTPKIQLTMFWAIRIPGVGLNVSWQFCPWKRHKTVLACCVIDRIHSRNNEPK